MTQHSNRRKSQQLWSTMMGRLPRKAWKAGLIAIIATLLVSVPVILSTSSTVRATDKAITGLTLTSPNPGELTITWDLVSPAPDDYRVMWAPSSGKFLSFKDANTDKAGNAYPTSTSHTVTGLPEGEEYKVRVRARYGEEKAGPFSNLATVTISSTPEPTPQPTSEPAAETPAKPTGLLTGASHHSVLLSWTDPDDDSITGYQVLRGPDATSLTMLVDDTGSAISSYMDRSVAAETKYVYAVRARNAHGLSPQSDPVSVTTLAAPEEPNIARAIAGVNFTLDGQALDTTGTCSEDSIGDITDACTIDIDKAGVAFAVVGELDGNDRLSVKIGRDLAAVNAATEILDEGDLQGTNASAFLNFNIGRNLLRVWGDEDQSSGDDEEHFFRVNLVPYWSLNGERLSKHADCRSSTDRTASEITDDDCIVTQFGNTAKITFVNVIHAHYNAYVHVNDDEVVKEPDDAALAGPFTLDLQDGDNVIKVRLASKGGDGAGGYGSDSFHYKLTTDVLVSNLGQVRTGGYGIVDTTFGAAQPFTTGAHPDGYVVTTVRVNARAGAGTGTGPKVSVYSNVSGLPGASLKVLTNPSNIPTDEADVDFDADGFILHPNTTYWIVVEKAPGTADVGVSYTNATAEDAGGAANWSIGDRAAELSGGSWGLFTGPTLNVRIAVIGRHAADATLSALVLRDAGNNAIALTPPFASGATMYSASVENSVAQIKVQPTANDANATIAYLDNNEATLTDADTNTQVFDFDLGVGPNIVKVKVTAHDPTSTQTYTITVERAASGTEPPTATISAVKSPILENTEMVEFDVKLNKDAPAGGLNVVVKVTHRVHYDVSPLAPGQLRNHTVNIPASQRTGRLTLQPVNNTLLSNNKPVVGTLQSGAGYTVGSTDSAEVVVKDDDTVTLGFSIACDQTYEVSESDGEVEYTLVITGGPVDFIFTAAVQTINGTANSPNDLVGDTILNLIPRLATSFTGRAQLVDDTQIEPHETFALALVRTGLDSRIKRVPCPDKSDPTATVGITDDDSVNLKFSVTEEVVEGNPITIELGPTPNIACPLPFILKANLAVSGTTSVLSDYSGQPIPVELNPCAGPDGLKIVEGSEKIAASLDTDADSGDGTRTITFTVQDIAAEGQPDELNQRILLAQRSRTVRIIDDPCTAEGRLRFNGTVPSNIDVFSNDADGTTITLPSWSGQVCWAQVYLGYIDLNDLQVYHANGKTMAGNSTTSVEAHDVEYSVDQATRELTIKKLDNDFAGAFWDVEEAYVLYPFDSWPYNSNSAVIEQVFRIRMHNLRAPNARYAKTDSSVRITASAGNSYSPYPDHPFNSGGFEVQRCLSSTGCAADSDWTQIRRTSYSTGTDWSLDFTTTLPDSSATYRYRTRQYINTRHGGGAHNGPWGSVWTSRS